MAGANLQFAPTLSGYGHFKVNYGQHFQLEKARDLIYFPYRLNGQDLNSFYASSYNRWGNETIDVSTMANVKGAKYMQRMGDETYKTISNKTPYGFESGGLRSDYLGMYEGFVAYENIDEARGNAANPDSSNVYYKNKNTGSDTYRYNKKIEDGSGNVTDTVVLESNTAFVPFHQKFTFNLDVDFAYDLGPMIGYPRDLFFSVYAALNGVSTSFKPIAFNDAGEDVLLWGTYIRLEPAIALTKKFYLLGLVGYENWRSQKSYIRYSTGNMRKPTDKVEFSPIDYRDYAMGLGFDWDMMSRVGLHGRVKYMWHDDINYDENSYKLPVVSAEIKTWF
jgi:hypothetical protein